MSSFKTPTKSVELVSDFFNAGRTGNIGKITVTGKFLGTHAYTPSVVELALYNVDSTTNGSMPFQTIVRANVTQGETGNITITYPTFFDSFDLEVAYVPSVSLDAWHMGRADKAACASSQCGIHG